MATIQSDGSSGDVAHLLLEAAEPATQAPRAARPRRRPRRPRGGELVGRLASRGAGPFLLTLDVLAWAVGSSLAGDPELLWVAFLLLMLLLLGTAGAYRSHLTMSVVQDGPRLVVRTLAAAAVIVGLDLLVLGRQADHRALVHTAVVVAVAVVVLRAIGYAFVRRARALGLVDHRTLVMGAGQVGAQLVDTLKEHPEYGLRPIGFLDSEPLLPPAALPAPVLGGNEDLAAAILQYDVDVVIVAFGSLKEHQLVEVLRTCDRMESEIFLVPRLFELHSADRDMDHVWGIPLIRHRRAAFRSVSWQLKRLLDVVVSASALLVLAPLLLALAVAVRLEGGPGLIFRQVRVGLDGRPFELVKFRSLRPVDTEESATRWNIADDERLGPVGRLLRRSSLDELPQLWNILRGDMSLVGPRPERPHFVDTFASTLPRYTARHRVPAGLTGWAQVHGLRGDTSIADRARFDNYYIENWSLGLDLRILCMTIVSVVTRRGG